jgi:hypothetical protein
MREEVELTLTPSDSSPIAVRRRGESHAGAAIVEVPLLIEGAAGGPGVCQPATVGIPFPKGVLRDPETLRLIAPDGRTAVVQASPLAHWSDGSVRWLLVDFVLGPGIEGSTEWALGQAPVADYQSLREPLCVRQSSGSIAVETGKATFQIGRHGLPLLRAAIEGRDLVDPESVRIVLTDQRGRRVLPQVEEVTQEADGPVRATVRITGRFEGRARCRFVARLCFFADTGLVRFRLTLHNADRARHRGGLWDLGDPGSILFRELSLELALASPGEPRVLWAAEAGQSSQALAGGNLEIYQDTSGGEHWRSRNHADRHGRIPCSFRGYRVRVDGREKTGLRASPIASLHGQYGDITVAVPEFWQQFPKAIEVAGRTLRIGLFPRQFGDPFELQGGERKTHTLWLHFGAGHPASAPLAWVHYPACVLATPVWYAASGAIPHLTPASPSGGRLESLLTEVMDGPRSFFAHRELIDEYGWRNFGEIYADHEVAYYPGPPPVISHYNNQYDCLYGATLQYLRTGDPRWLEVLDPLARHVMDIDIYHTNRDRAAYNGGLFWFTDHYLDAATCTHRTYSRRNQQPGQPYGGGPSSSHNFTTGLLHYYYLTGDPDARDAVIELADWVLNMDDGRKNLLGLLDDGPTGLASATGQADYHGPGRGCGNSVNALLDAWLATNHRHYLDRAEDLIRRSVHPADDVAARDLLNVEKRWSYTVYLSTLGRYLDAKAEAGERDFMYSYARASLLAYARWMLEHEVPYFDRAEQLEYPTEAWAGQEFRKANVLRIASAHAEEPLRLDLFRRGGELADRAWADLMRFESRTSARAVALLMVEGSFDSFFRGHSADPAPRPVGAHDFGAPIPFVPQKARVLAQLRTVRGFAQALSRLANVRWWWRFISGTGA